MIPTPAEKALEEAAEIEADRLFPRSMRDRWNEAYLTARRRQAQPEPIPANMEQRA